ncbi:MBL fold metallo-hydrolase [Chitinophagaceae bacterium LB-8]|uniref:MBL fold metallo-hydrolase n=1 Tax=Paraflavisolibacter caeni TaxID=2982496 RepID=A0A9X2XV90_9BACT|nr:MBL fold metallo-hydrolase [Paraflavisolibacter caeni]MCU7549949.1 MBL fold metallo-hydrolase [Paraflavisolibacter caeni]
MKLELHISHSNQNNICVTCGTRYATAKSSTDACPVCNDDRQYIGDQGQQWTSYEQLAKVYAIRFSKLHDNLYDLRMMPSFAIGQRAHLVIASSGNILWDCLPYINAETVAYINALGGLKAIVISHPHYYGLMVEWAGVFDCPVYLHANDGEWVMDHDPHIQLWEGAELTLWDGVRIVHTAGHFPGSVVLHIPNGAGTLLTGDTIYVSRDRKQVSAMYSYPNMIPLSKSAIEHLVEQVKPLVFDRLYGAFEFMNIHEGAKDIVDRSFNRYLQILEG